MEKSILEYLKNYKKELVCVPQLDMEVFTSIASFPEFQFMIGGDVGGSDKLTFTITMELDTYQVYIVNILLEYTLGPHPTINIGSFSSDMSKERLSRFIQNLLHHIQDRNAVVDSDDTMMIE